MPGFGPAAEVIFFREKDPKPFSPRSATLNRADAGPRRAAQLAGLRQGPPVNLSVSPVGRPGGGGWVEHSSTLQSLDNVSQFGLFGYRHQFGVISDQGDGFTFGQGQIQAVIHRMVELNREVKGPFRHF